MQRLIGLGIFYFCHLASKINIGDAAFRLVFPFLEILLGLCIQSATPHVRIIVWYIYVLLLASS